MLQKISRDIRLRRAYESWKEKTDSVDEKIARAKLAAARGARKKRTQGVEEEEVNESVGYKSYEDGDESSSSRPAQEFRPAEGSRSAERSRSAEGSRPAEGSRKGDLCATCDAHATSR